MEKGAIDLTAAVEVKISNRRVLNFQRTEEFYLQ